MSETAKLYRFFFVLFLIGVVIVVAGIFGSITSALAERRGHLRRKWFWLGAFFWIFAIAALLIMKPGPAAQTRRHRGFQEWIRHPFEREHVWAEAAGTTSRVPKTVSVITVAVVGFVTGWLLIDPVWGWTLAILGGAGATVILMIASVVGERVVVDPDYQPSERRPPTPRRSVTLLPSLGIVLAGFGLGGLAGDLLWGIVWGVIGGGAAVAALIVAKEKVDYLDMGILLAGAVASTVLTTLVLPGTFEALSANLSLRMAGAWIPAGVAAAFVLWRKSPSPAKALTMVLGWTGAGLLALPAIVSWDVLKPLESTIGDSSGLGYSYLFIGVTVGIMGGAFLLSGLTGLNVVATVSTLAFMSLYAGAQVGFTIPGLISNFSNAGEIGKLMWPPDFDWAIGTGQWWWLPSWDFGSELRANPLMETFRIAIVACLIGVTLAIPLALRASKITAIRGSDYWLNKGIMNVIRTIPDLFWAMIFATSVGIGPFAGTLALIFFSMAIMAKLLSETVDAVDPRPIEAARATGSHHWPAIRTSVWPQVLPNYVAYALYIFEINIRASVVLGIVGAGGIGRVLEAQRSFFKFDRVLAIVLVIFVIVFLIEQVSVALRRRLV
ncbi:MAG: phosphonate ABC transporter, permease protein PhnE [Actinobacteria bacterium]|nr:phosphonate ABC transporter, permease protein PhnE [Actinomycetota bacterium]